MIFVIDEGLNLGFEVTRQKSGRASSKGPPKQERRFLILDCASR